MRLTVRSARIAFTAILAVIGAVALIGGIGYGLTNDQGLVGTGFMPAIVGGVVLLLALIDIAQSLLRREPTHDGILNDLEAEVDEAAIDAATPDADAESPDVDVLGRTQRQRNRMLAIVGVLVVVSLLLVPLVGFLISMGLLVLAIAIGVERMRVVPSLIVVVVALAVFWLVFGQLLNVPLPTGLLGLI